MSTIPSKELLKLWRLEKLTDEMAIGHIIQNLVNMQKAVDATNTDFFNLRADIDELARHANVKLGSRYKKNKL